MSFDRPPLPEIIRRETSDFEYELGSQAPRLPGTVEYAFVRAHAGVAHGLHGRLDRVRRDAFWATSSDEALIQKAGLFGVTHIPATRSTGVLGIPATVNAVVPAGTVFVREDGAEYETTQSVIAAGGNAFAPTKARVSGVAGNMSQFTSLVLKEPVVDLVGTAVAESGFANGAEAETTQSLRRRLAHRLDQPPKGGGPGDYVRWALGESDPDKVPADAVAPAGVTRAWEFGRVPKLGNVTVLIMCDDFDEPIPTVEKLAEVTAWINLFAPIALPEVIVLAPIPKVLNITIELTIETDADPVETRAAIVQALKDMITAKAEPWKDGNSVFYKSWITQAISNTPGELDHKVTVPAGDVALAQWELVTLGTVSIP